LFILSLLRRAEAISIRYGRNAKPVIVEKIADTNPAVVGDPLPGEPELAACRTLCERGDQAACINYKGPLCDQNISRLP